MNIALASSPLPASIADGLNWLEKLTAAAAEQNAAIVCFPETFIPGYPLNEYQPEKGSPEKMQDALDKACAIAKKYNIAIILPMDRYTATDAILNIAMVISKTGELLGYQTKNQLDPSEDGVWQAGTERELFEIDGMKFGITICHEGFRYPESVRWAAQRGAVVVFHPHCTGSNVIEAPAITEWGHKDSPYYEKAMMMRAMENTIYFAGSNYAMRYPESASSIIAPDGKCLAHAEYGKPGVIVVDIDPEQATGLLAKRFKPELVY
ncbi:MAG: carbon-nitrogen hydrolase family protein [Mucilaginibacter sp.]